MKLIDERATIKYLETINSNTLRLFNYEFTYHPSRFATGTGSRLYCKALANFAANRANFAACGEIEDREKADKYAMEAKQLLAKYKEK